MGHLYPKNISEIVLEELNENRLVSIAGVVHKMKQRGETAHAAEGEYDEDYMLSMSAGIVVAGLCHNMTPSLLRPVPQNDAQDERKDCEGSEGWEDEDYEIYDTMPWVPTEEGAKLLKRGKFPVIDYVDV